MSNRRFSIFAIVAGGCFIAAMLALQDWSSSDPEAEVASSAVPVHAETVKVGRERVLLTDELPGRVAAFKKVEIRPQVSGIIKKKVVEAGSRVSAGQILFEIEPALFLADLETARAALTRAESALEHARSGFQRAEALLASKAASQKNYEDARNDMTVAQANLAEARAVFNRRQLDLDFATIRSPIDGYVGRTVADEGSLASISGQTELAVVQQLERVYVDLRLPATKLDSVQFAAEEKIGQIEILRADGKPYSYSAKLVLSDVTVDAVTGNATIRVLVENPELQLLPGMFVRAQVPSGLLSDVILVPEYALVRTGGDDASLMVVDPDGRVKRRKITLGEAISRRVVVKAGLQPGETIVIRGQERLQDGMLVNADNSPNATTVKDKI
ncbi:efflux RND transporter periplasmic adaptor subunit [Brucella pseudogrignonensis]|uniref:efflux RND transporter periplasmic adaptor subunit n=1 Tax=Brucella pseudogrignonensis TaxID=419475 RepID=UPI0028B60F89|nr:efflux RND transporter periplasmic adaptor subunit [Brucella pseudogrignonensis]MDT6941133.1 efflux RND transporter periplasmic adaptor subunit [Brucella pseudogrignonensis]